MFYLKVISPVFTNIFHREADLKMFDSFKVIINNINLGFLLIYFFCYILSCST